MLAAPTRIPRTNDDRAVYRDQLLGDPDMNRRLYCEYANEVGPSDFVKRMYGLTSLYRLGKKCFALDFGFGRISYFFNWKERKVLGLQAACDIAVWRTGGVPPLRLAIKTLLRFLLSQYDVVVMNRMRSSGGMPFCHNVLKVALEVEHCCVYHADVRRRAAHRIKSVDEVQTLQADLWNPVDRKDLVCIAKAAIW